MRLTLVSIGNLKKKVEIGMNHMDLVNQVVELELDMFERVRTSKPSLCQEKPEWMDFWAH